MSQSGVERTRARCQNFKLAVAPAAGFSQEQNGPDNKLWTSQSCCRLIHRAQYGEVCFHISTYVCMENYEPPNF